MAGSSLKGNADGTGSQMQPEGRGCQSQNPISQCLMKVGYARVSASDEAAALQVGALEAEGCERVFVDEGTSGLVSKRPNLERAMKALRPGDTLVVCKLDRLGRSLSHLVQLVADLGERGVIFRSLSDSFDTGLTGGRLVLRTIRALAEFERGLLTERSRAGLDAAKRRGQRLGRKPSLTPDQIAHARQLVESGEHPRTVARSLHVGRATLYRHFQKAATL